MAPFCAWAAPCTRSASCLPPDRLLAALGELEPGRLVWEALPLEHPELAVEMPGVAGLLIVPLGGDGDTLVFVRGEVSRSIDWLGDQRAENRDHPLSPRRSFSAWRESVTGRSLPWGEHAQDALDLGEEIRSAMTARTQAELAELALRDPLTGLHNRRFLDDRLEELLQAPDRPVALVFLDLDDFKVVNDTYGHEMGDAVLAAIGKRLSGVARRLGRRGASGRGRVRHGLRGRGIRRGRRDRRAGGGGDQAAHRDPRHRDRGERLGGRRRGRAGRHTR